jgi:uracil-DNA glycosylase
MLEKSLSNLKTNWVPLISSCLKKYSEIDSKLSEEQENFEGLSEIYPPIDLIFNCFNYFNVEETKVVILGQDPYHQPNQAMGLSFSVPNNVKIPPSLVNIFKEIQNNFNSKPSNGNLEFWAKQGVLLLNNTLTVRQSSPNSHLKIWKGFTQEILNKMLEVNKDVIFLVWGGNAKKCIEKLQIKYTLKSNHPSPLSANRGGWFGCEHFKECNRILKELNEEEINWIPQ